MATQRRHCDRARADVAVGGGAGASRAQSRRSWGLCLDLDQFCGVNAGVVVVIVVVVVDIRLGSGSVGIRSRDDVLFLFDDTGEHVFDFAQTVLDDFDIALWRSTLCVGCGVDTLSFCGLASTTSVGDTITFDSPPPAVVTCFGDFGSL